MRIFALVAGLALVSSSAFAGICNVHVKRVSCPGKDKESFAKCEGKAECDNKKKADTEADCTKLAKDECSNSRTDITKSKEVTAIFDGKALGGNVCEPNRPDFNKC